MKKILLILFCSIALFSCKNGKKTPDVSNIKVDLQVLRFEKDFFSLDTTNLDASLEQLHQKYPTFMQDFVFNILSQPSSIDTVKRDIVSFLRSYRSLYDSSQLIFNNIDDEVKTVKRGLQFTRYYFPKYNLPPKLITFIGPINSYSNVITSDALAVGLQLYMGKNYSIYNSEAGQQLYPAFVSRRFERAYIPVNCMKNIVSDISDNTYHNSTQGRSLIEQMVEAGRRLYLLDKLLPEVADTLKTGYTKAQLEGAYANELGIWSYFLNSDILFTTDPNIIKDYMNDGPNTTALGPASPGFIGQFVGWQIVKKWMDQKERSMDELMKTPAKQIFEEAKYKPNR
jgi:hypothetical protein